MSEAIQNHSEEAAPENFSGRGRLGQMVKELNRQMESKVDFVADERQFFIEAGDALLLTPKPSAVQLQEFMDSSGIPLNDNALLQLGDKQSPRVPNKFIRDLAAEMPQTAANMLNDLLGKSSKRRMVRSLDGQVRAYLSDSYRVIDNYDIALVALESARENGGQVIEASLSDSHMRIKFTTQEVWDKVDTKTQDGGAGSQGNHEFIGRTMGWDNLPQEDLPGGPGTVHPLVTISNSETGQGGFSVQMGLLQAICINGLTIDTSIRKFHLGGKIEAGLLSAEALKADSQAIFLKARDLVTSAFNQEKFKALVKKAQSAQDVEVRSPSAAVDHIIKGSSHLSEDAKDSILEYFLGDYDRTAYGLAQGLSRYSQDIENANAAAGIEVAAGEIVNSPGKYALMGV